MGFPKERHSGFNPLPWNRINNDQWVDSIEATQMIGNVQALHGHTRRMVASSLGLGPDEGETDRRVYTVSPGRNAEIFRLPLNEVVTGAGGWIRVTIYAARTDGSAPDFMSVMVGREFARTDFSSGAGAFDLVTVLIPVQPNQNPALISAEEIVVSLGVDWEYGEGNEDTIEVSFVSCYEVGDPSARTWKDTTGTNNKIGQPDYPFSPGMQRILVGNSSAVYGNRTPKAQILQRCFALCYKNLTGSYGTGADLGEWIVRKPRGATSVEGIYYVVPRVTTPPGVDTVDIKVTLWSIESIAYDNEVAAFTAGDILTGQTSGATARILDVVDAGSTGTIYLGFVTGTFQNNETLKDESGGQALANGTLAGPAEFASTTDSPSTGTHQEFEITGLVEEEMEFWVGIDAKTAAGSSADVCFIPWILMVDGLGTDVTAKIPRTSHVEMEDDVRASTIKNAKTTLEKLWARNRSILLSDFRFYSSGQAEGKQVVYDSGESYNPSLTQGAFGRGAIYPSPGARQLKARVWVRRTDTRFVRKQLVTGMSGTPQEGETATGGTSGATATVEKYTASGGVLTVKDLSGAFQDSETISFSGGGSCTASGVPYTFDADLRLRLDTLDDASGNILTKEVNLSDMARGEVRKVEIVVPISTEYENDYSVVDQYPYLWALQPLTDAPGDHLILEKYQIFEKPLLPGMFDVSLEDY